MRHTVFTPVYNRLAQMKSLYSHMLELNYPKNEWEWLIIDDGSTDGLDNFYKSVLAKSNEINVRYIKKSNGGIHSAQNMAIIEAYGEYITRCDSDDFLLKEALQKKDQALNAILADDNPSIAGVVGSCLNAGDLSFRSSKLIEDKILTTGIKLRKNGATGDRNFCMKVSVMRQYLIPEFEDTKWVPESNWVWGPIDLKYLTYFVNEPMSVCAEPNPDSVTGQLKKRTVSNLMSPYYAAVGLLNNVRQLFPKKTILKQFLIIAVNGCKADRLSNANRIRQAFKLLNHKKDRLILTLIYPFALLYSRLTK